MENKKTKAVTATLIAYLLFFVSVIICSIVPTETETAETITSIIVKVICSGVMLLIMTKAYHLETGLKKDGLGKGIYWFGLPMLLISLFQLVYDIPKPEMSVAAAIPKILLLAVSCLAIGLFEEVMFRGFIFNVFLKRFGETKKGASLAVMLSSILFGCTHLINLLANPKIVNTTLSQIVYATMLGVFLCAIFYRRGNLFACILLHAIFDFAPDLFLCFVNNVEETGATDISVIDALTGPLVISPLLIAGIWQLRNIFKEKGMEIEGSSTLRLGTVKK